MNRSFLLAFVVLSTLSVSCTTSQLHSQSGQMPAVLATGQSDEIQREARRQAKTDIAAGHPRVCYAGTRGTSFVGVPDELLPAVSGLPRVPLPVGCTTPHAASAFVFGIAYNKEMVAHLRRQQGIQKNRLGS